ncbi:hypothetical protein [Staphylococcus chromogenes]|uniref:hypothetical protein n=1 Tax=Staphylococcus chromogenes TaxID=46126 RepID=UPI00189087E8|nr:hypothetical protein [Staphylococcus chromogenes]HDF3152201.1 hypothetical protein [Staphylococcus aureus]
MNQIIAKELQRTFNIAEEVVSERLETLPIFTSYKEVLKSILGINEDIFDMLYDDDTENFDEYDFEHLDSSDWLEAVDKLNYYVLVKH